jgi:predicted nuclease of predicted toxin-antitoxin system
MMDADHEAKHALDLPLRNCTSDYDIIDITEREGRIVVTKDDDFVQSFLVNDKPSRLLLIATGNISNAELEKLIRANLKAIVSAFEMHRFIELGRDVLVIHE